MIATGSSFADAEAAAETAADRTVGTETFNPDAATFNPGSVNSGTLQRAPAAPLSAGQEVPFDRSIVDLFPVSDVRTDLEMARLMAIAKVGFANFSTPTITRYTAELYDPGDRQLGTSTSGVVPKSTPASFSVFPVPVTSLVQGRYTLRCIGYDGSALPVAYADRTFYVWTSPPTGKPPDIAALETKKTQLEATTKKGSGESFGKVGAAFAELKDVTHDLSVLTTGTGTYVGNQCAIQPGGTTPTDCTNIVLEVLKDTFTQQGRAADWTKVEKKYRENKKLRGAKDLSGLDVQAALQSEAGWKGVYWAPDPTYQIPDAELAGGGMKSGEANYNLTKAKKGTYYKDTPKKGYPGVSIDHIVTNYAPETPTSPRPATYPGPSTTTKDMSQLNKLKKLPFGILSAHGAYHMTIITYGKVIEVHLDKAATSTDVIQQTDLESWAIGKKSGYHYYASGAIVGPAADIDAAFK